jgi:hypothetical protein
MTQRVLVFFYGSYINREVLHEVGLIPERTEVACLPGYDIRVAPLANLVPAEEHSVYGILADATHAELERLYAHARDVLGGVYLPRAVTVETRDGSPVPALCYLAEGMEERPPDPAYLERILGPARQYGFPAWYLERLASFRPR